MMDKKIHRRTGLAAIAGVVATTGCDRVHRSARAAQVPSPASAPVCAAGLSGAGIRVDVVIDRTTVFDARARADIARVLLEAAEQHGGHWSVALTGGRDAALIRKITAVQLADAGEREKLRWRDSPAARARAGRCQRDQQEALASALRAGLGDTDTGLDGYSPLCEAMHSLLAGRNATRRTVVVLASDGVENVPGRSFYASRGRGLQLPAVDRLVGELQRQAILPDASNVAVVHVGLGWNDIDRAAVRPTGELAALERLWKALWAAAGASSVTVGRPLPVSGLPL